MNRDDVIKKLEELFPQLISVTSIKIFDYNDGIKIFLEYENSIELLIKCNITLDEKIMIEIDNNHSLILSVEKFIEYVLYEMIRPQINRIRGYLGV